MFKEFKGAAALLLTVLALMVGVLLVPASASATCYGTLYEYFESSALQVQVGSTVVCPGFPDQHDEDVNGNYIETPWFTTTTIVCPCAGSGGGGGGGGEDEDAPEGP